MKTHLFLMLTLLLYGVGYSQSNSWINTSLTIHGTDYFKDISLSDKMNGLAIGIDHTGYNPRYKTTDGGNTWTRQNWNYRGNACIHYNKNGDAITAKIDLATSNVLRISNNYATNWSTIAAPSINSQWGTKSCWIKSATEYFVVGAGGWGNDDGVYRRKNGVWEHVIKSVDATKIYFVDDQVGFVGTQYGDLYRTLDSGNTWENINYPGSKQIDEINAVSKDLIYMGQYKTTDGGKNWSSVSFGIEIIGRYHFFNELEAYGVTGQTDVYATSDGGSNWTLISTNKIIDNPDEIACCDKFIFMKDKIFALSDAKPKIYLMNVDTTLSTNEFSKTSVEIFPNPANDYLNIKAETAINDISIYDLKGRLVKTASFNNNSSNENQLKIASLAQGLYFLEMKFGQFTLTKKFFKN